MEGESDFDKYHKIVTESPHDFTSWEYLIRLAEAEGNHQKSSQVLSEFLGYFPLCYGYWKKYADNELAAGGDMRATEAYEKGVAAAPYCLELWVYYCTFLVDKFAKENPENVRSVFERAVSKVGIHFLSHTIWDKYIEFEENYGNDQVFPLLERIIRIPLQQYTRFYDKYVQMSNVKPLTVFATKDELRSLEEKMRQEDENLKDEMIQSKLREVVMKKKVEINKKTEEETRRRWSYEEAAVPTYFHVKALDETHLQNWRVYLDFEEKEGDHERIIALYERCLIPCALYEEFWIRYARYFERRDEINIARSLFQRALSGFLSKKPTLIIAKAMFEEQYGSVDEARSLLESTRSAFMGHVEAIIASANLERRQSNISKAEEILEEGLTLVDHKFTPYFVCHVTKFYSNISSNPEKARKLFIESLKKYNDSKLMFSNFLLFELSQTDDPKGLSVLQRVKFVFDLVNESNLSNEDKAEFLLHHLEFISDRCPTLDGYAKVHAEYTRLKNLGSSRKRPAEDDLSKKVKQIKTPQEQYLTPNVPAQYGYNPYQAYPQWGAYQGYTQEWPTQ